MKFVVIFLAALFCFSQSDARTKIEGGNVVFVNLSGNSYKDSLKTDGDTLSCVINQVVNGVLAKKMVLTLPDVLESGDSCAIYLRTLPFQDAEGTLETRNWENQYEVKDNIVAPMSKGSNIGESYYLGNWAYGDGIADFAWSPQDSVISPRVEILIKEGSGTPMVTGSDSLGTSLTTINKVFED